MRIEIPKNKVSHDYEKVLDEFVSSLKSRLGESLLMVYLTGSYARGDANDTSDLDVFCIFSNINQQVLETVGFCARNTSVSYDALEINTQSLSVEEYKSKIFEDWSEYAVTELNSVLLYGEQLVQVDEPKELLTYKKIATYILKPLMFALRQERFCTIGVYPLSIEQLLESYQDDNKILVEYFMNREKLEQDMMLFIH